MERICRCHWVTAPHSSGGYRNARIETMRDDEFMEGLRHDIWTGKCCGEAFQIRPHAVFQLNYAQCLQDHHLDSADFYYYFDLWVD